MTRTKLAGTLAAAAVLGLILAQAAGPAEADPARLSGYPVEGPPTEINWPGYGNHVLVSAGGDALAGIFLSPNSFPPAYAWVDGEDGSVMPGPYSGTFTDYVWGNQVP